MPTEVYAGFSTFLRGLVPTSGETAAARSHRASIKECLMSEFGMTDFVPIGSFYSGTSVSGFSDVDYIAVIPTSNLKQDSSRTLAAVSATLRERFSTTPNIRINCPAVRVPFGDGGKESTEIVPADEIDLTDAAQYVYDIPDCNGGWRRSSPEAHYDYVDAIDKRLAGNLRPLIRLVKAWKYYCSVPISSFYLEMYVARYAANEKSIIYYIDLDAIFRALYYDELPSFQDPVAIAGTIAPCTTPSNHDLALDQVLSGHVHAEHAEDARRANKNKDAFYWWNEFFNGNFPAYG